MAKIEVPLIDQIPLPDSAKIKLKTLDQHISEKYSKVKEDIIDFAFLSKTAMLDSSELQHLKGANIRSITRGVPATEASLEVLRSETCRALQQDNCNAVLKSIINAENFAFFREKVIQDVVIDQDEICIDDLIGDKDGESSATTKSIADQTQGFYKLPPKQIKNKDGDLCTERDIIDEAFQLYVKQDEPLIKTKAYNVTCLLNKVHMFYQVLRSRGQTGGSLYRRRISEKRDNNGASSPARLRPYASDIKPENIQAGIVKQPRTDTY